MEHSKANDSCMNPSLIVRYISGNVSEQEKEESEAHLSSCSECLLEYLVSKRVMEDGAVYDFKPISQKAAEEILEPFGLYKKKPGVSFSGLLEKAGEYCQRAIHAIMPPQAVLQRSGKRNGAERNKCRDLSKQFDGFSVTLSLEMAEDRNPCLNVTVPDGHEKLIRVTLESIADGDDDSRPMIADTETFGAVSFVFYRLHLKRRDLSEETILFSIDESGIRESHES